MALLVLGGLAFPAPAQENIPLEQAQNQIRAHVTTLEGHRAAGDNLYAYEYAGPTLDAAFKAKGVEWARRYSGDWGHWVYTTWSYVQFYKIHRAALDDSLQVVTNQGFATPRQLAYLRDGMNAFSGEHEALLQQMHAFAELYADKAAVLDKNNALPADAPESSRRALEEQANDLDVRIEQLKQGGIAPFYDKRVFDSLANMCGPDSVNKSFAGKWNTSWGPMTLAVNGSRLSGNYEHDRGQIEGTLAASGMQAEGHWAEQPSYRAPDDAGQFRLTLAADGRSFSGPWGYGEQFDRGEWKASRANDPCAPPPPTLAGKQETTKLRYVVGKLEVRNTWWEAHRSHIKGEIEMANNQIARHQKALDAELAELQKADLQADEVMALRSKSWERLAAARAEIDKLKNAQLPVPPEKQKEFEKLDDDYWNLLFKEGEARRKAGDVAVPVQVSFDYIARFKKERADLEREMNAVAAAGAPILESVSVWTDKGKTVFRAEQGASSAEVDRMNREVADMEEAVEALRQSKDKLFAIFKDNVETGNAYLQELHGDITPGTGAWSAVSNLFSGGRIMNSARNQALIDGAVVIWELAEAGATGGPLLILADVMNKFVMAGVQAGLEGPLESEKLVTDVEDIKINKQYGAEIYSPISTTEIEKTLLYRAIEDGAVRHGRDAAYQKMEKWRADRARRAYDFGRAQAHGDKVRYVNRMLDRSRSVAELKRRAEQLDASRKKLWELGDALKKTGEKGKPPYGMTSLGMNLARDAIKSLFKELAKREENATWRAFAVTAASQPALYNLWSIAAGEYWLAYDRLQVLRKKRDELAAGFDPYSGFTIPIREAFEEDARLSIGLTLKQPKGHREDVTLGGIAAELNPSALHEYRLSADRLAKPAKAKPPVPVDLSIMHKEPAQN